ncbi:MAG TPA: dockerin type I domain-containing protein [Thermoguttaceae bacterium]|nr:dockerin type I domain-containing protein [Thermoguttaceae bacterium]
MRGTMRRVGLGLLVAVASFVAVQYVSADVVDAKWEHAGNGNWNLDSNWSGGKVPNNGEDNYNVLINSHDPVAIVSLDTNATINNLAIGPGNALVLNNSQRLSLVGVNATINNQGIINVNSTGSDTYLYLDASVGTTLTGGGTVSMSHGSKACLFDPSIATPSHLINENNTIQGIGQLGGNTLALVNRGVVHANLPGELAINPPAGVDVDGTGSGMLNDIQGILRASNGATLSLQDGVFKNRGIVEALNGSIVSYSLSATLQNNVYGILTEGTWRAVWTHGEIDSHLTLRGDNITRIAANTTVELSGTKSYLNVATTPLENTLTTNDGTLRLLGGRGYTTANAFTNGSTGILEFEGGAATFSGGLTNHGALRLSTNTFLDVGTLSLDGTLDVRLADGTTPTSGATFDLFNATSLVGTFDTLILPELDGGLQWDTDDLYLSGNISVVSSVSAPLGPPGDANGDHYVDEEDAQILAAHWGQAGDWTTGDFNGDDLVNAADASILAANWGYHPLLENRSTVPEPSGLVLLLGFILTMGGRKRR